MSTGVTKNVNQILREEEKLERSRSDERAQKDQKDASPNSLKQRTHVSFKLPSVDDDDKQIQEGNNELNHERDSNQ